MSHQSLDFISQDRFTLEISTDVPHSKLNLLVSRYTIDSVKKTLTVAYTETVELTAINQLSRLIDTPVNIEIIVYTADGNAIGKFNFGAELKSIDWSQSCMDSLAFYVKAHFDTQNVDIKVLGQNNGE